MVQASEEDAGGRGDWASRIWSAVGHRPEGHLGIEGRGGGEGLPWAPAKRVVWASEQEGVGEVRAFEVIWSILRQQLHGNNDNDSNIDEATNQEKSHQNWCDIRQTADTATQGASSGWEGGKVARKPRIMTTLGPTLPVTASPSCLRVAGVLCARTGVVPFPLPSIPR